MPDPDRRDRAGASLRRWSVALAVLFAVIIVPFLVAGDRLESAAAEMVDGRMARPWLVLAIAGLLASDIVLPVPSSIVATAAGALLGVWLGAFASALGMSIGCAVGYGLGRGVGRPLTRRLVGDAELARADAIARRLGSWMLVVLRPVPVLAEASTLLAGINRVPPMRFAVFTTLANIGIAVAYAFAGALAVSWSTFLLSFAAACLLPGAAMLATRWWTGTTGSQAAASNADSDGGGGGRT